MSKESSTGRQHRGGVQLLHPDSSECFESPSSSKRKHQQDRNASSVAGRQTAGAAGPHNQHQFSQTHNLAARVRFKHVCTFQTEICKAFFFS